MILFGHSFFNLQKIKTKIKKILNHFDVTVYNLFRSNIKFQTSDKVCVNCATLFLSLNYTFYVILRPGLGFYQELPLGKDLLMYQ